MFSVKVYSRLNKKRPPLDKQNKQKNLSDANVCTQFQCLFGQFGTATYLQNIAFMLTIYCQMSTKSMYILQQTFD